MDSCIEIASSRTELIINRTAVGVMLATLPRQPTNGIVTAANATNAPTASHPSAYLVVSSRRRARPRMTNTITPPPSARTRACFTDVDMSASVNDDRRVVGCSPGLSGDPVLLRSRLPNARAAFVAGPVGSIVDGDRGRRRQPRARGRDTGGPAG